MDALDVRIIAAMGPLPYAAAPGADALRPAAIARAVGASPETVRDRVARLESAGIIAGYEIVPNLRHFGLEASAFLLRVPDEARRRALRGATRNVEGLLEVTYFLGPEVCVDLSFASPGQRSRRVRALAEASGDPSPTEYLGWTMPAVAREPTALDWRIVKALRGRAKRSLVEVAEEMGVGYRTVKRHYDRMAEECAFFVKPLLDPATEPGFAPFTFLVHFAPGAPPRTAASVRKELGDHTVFAQAPTDASVANLDLVVFAATPAHAEELRRRAAGVPGVARVDALATTEVDAHGDWLDEAIEARIEGASKTA